MATITENEIKVQGIDALIKALGMVNAERFISLINREPFDYTEWHKDLWKGMSVEEVSHMAMRLREQEEP